MDMVRNVKQARNGNILIASFAFCIVTGAVLRFIFNQSINYHIDKLKKWVLGALVLLVYLCRMDATSGHISTLGVIVRRPTLTRQQKENDNN